MPSFARFLGVIASLFCFLVFLFFGFERCFHAESINIAQAHFSVPLPSELVLARFGFRGLLLLWHPFAEI